MLSRRRGVLSKPPASVGAERFLTFEPSEFTPSKKGGVTLEQIRIRNFNNIVETSIDLTSRDPLQGLAQAETAG